MLPKKNRLTKKEFTRVFQKGRTFASGDFVVKYGSYQRRSVRFAFSVGLKISKRATVRNALRRQLYQCVGGLVSPQSTTPAGDYVVVLRPQEKPVTAKKLPSSSCALLLEAIRKVGR